MAALLLGTAPLDFMDQAQAWDTQFTELSVAQQVARARPPRRPSFHFCKCCGEEIPEARRQAVEGCRYCVDCQTDIEGRAV